MLKWLPSNQGASLCETQFVFDMRLFLSQQLQFSLQLFPFFVLALLFSNIAFVL
jgi:hypothetical protein